MAFDHIVRKSNRLPDLAFIHAEIAQDWCQTLGIDLSNIAKGFQQHGKEQASAKTIARILNDRLVKDYNLIARRQDHPQFSNIEAFVTHTRLRCELFKDSAMSSEDHRSQLDVLYRMMLLAAFVRFEDKHPAAEKTVEASLPEHIEGLAGALQKLGKNEKDAQKTAWAIVGAIHSQHQAIGID